MLYRLDSFLLSKTQRGCDSVHSACGISKFALAKWTLVIASALFCAATLAEAIIAGEIAVILLGSIAWWFLLGRSVKEICERYDRDERLFLQKNMLPRMSPFQDQKTRIGFSLFMATFTFLCGLYGFVLIDVMLILCALSLLSWIVHVYVDSCIPRPPSKSKLEKLVETLMSWRMKPVPMA